MGSYNVSCGVSRVSISPGMPMVFIPLVHSNFTDYNGEKFKDAFGGAYIVSNNGPFHFFTPLTLPIIGEYGDYGRIESIKKSENIESIESIFQCSIDDFIENICFSPFKESKLKFKTAGMFVHGDVYHHMINECFDECGQLNTAFNNSYLYSFLLKSLGFEEGEKDKSRERYNIPFVHPQIPDLTIWSDDTWTEVFYKNKKQESFYNPKVLHKFLVKNKLFVPDALLELKKRSYEDVLYEEGLLHYNRFVEANEIVKKSIGEKIEKLKNVSIPDTKKIDELTSLMINFGNMDMMNALFLNFGMGSQFLKMHSHLLGRKSFREEFVNFRTFTAQMAQVNSILMSSYNGPQYGNYFANNSLAAITKKICDKQIKSCK